MQTSWEAITHPDPVIVSRRRLDEKAAEVFYKASEYINTQAPKAQKQNTH